MKKVIIIGSGLSSLSAACYLAKEGHCVSIYEKNNTIGGRARQYKRGGFTFDMGPTFYWMPDVFERFFNDFGYKTEDFYNIIRLDPGYKIYFGKDDAISIPVERQAIFDLFEENEPGSSKFLRQFLKEAEYNYKVAMDKIVYKPGLSPTELITKDTITRFTQFMLSLSQKVRKNISNPKLIHILEFPVLFLGAKPSAIPAFYCFMNYADFIKGTWHVEGGIYEMVKGMEKLALELGVTIHTASPVKDIVIDTNRVEGVIVKGVYLPADAVISGADYQHTETLLPKENRNYSDNYWDKRVMAPSALMFYIGFDKEINNVSHHTLFFDADFTLHAEEIYDKECWPEKPLFYVSFPTKTDVSMGPKGKDCAVVLIPIAAGLEDSKELRTFYFDMVISRMEEMTGQSIKNSIIFHESFCVSDFKKDYNAFKGNAYGLSNVLFQTAFLKPKIINKSLSNMFYTGQLTVPGPGMPPAIISGKIASKLACMYLRN